MIVIECSAFFAAMNPKIAHRVSLSLAKKAAAFFKMSRSSARIRFSRRSRRSSSRSSVVRPSASPSSTSTWRDQLRSDCSEQPSSRASCGIGRPLDLQQPDRLGPELLRIRRRLWHRQTSSPPASRPSRSDVHETGGTPERHSIRCLAASACGSAVVVADQHARPRLAPAFQTTQPPTLVQKTSRRHRRLQNSARFWLTRCGFCPGSWRSCSRSWLSDMSALAKVVSALAGVAGGLTALLRSGCPWSTRFDAICSRNPPEAPRRC